MIGRLIEANKLIRRLVLVWAVVLNTWVVYKVFTDPPDITTGTAAALASVITIFTGVIGFYQWSRGREDMHGTYRRPRGKESNCSSPRRGSRRS